VVDVCNKISGRGVPIFAFANNHYAGNGPATVRLFQELWEGHARQAEQVLARKRCFR